MLEIFAPFSPVSYTLSLSQKLPHFQSQAIDVDDNKVKKKNCPTLRLASMIILAITTFDKKPLLIYSRYTLPSASIILGEAFVNTLPGVKGGKLGK